MGDVINIQDYKIGQSFEEDYQKFLVHVNKHNGIPTNTPELCKCFYNIMRYLEGTVNCFETLTLINGETKETEEMRLQIISWLDGISNDLKKY